MTNISRILNMRRFCGAGRFRLNEWESGTPGYKSGKMSLESDRCGEIVFCKRHTVMF